MNVHAPEPDVLRGGEQVVERTQRTADGRLKRVLTQRESLVPTENKEGKDATQAAPGPSPEEQAGGQAEQPEGEAPVQLGGQAAPHVGQQMQPQECPTVYLDASKGKGWFYLSSQDKYWEMSGQEYQYYFHQQQQYQQQQQNGQHQNQQHMASSLGGDPEL